MTDAVAEGLRTIVEIRSDAWPEALPDAEAVCRRAARAALDGAGAEMRDAEVSIVLGDDALLQELNRDWRGIDAPTNVLAFPCDQPAAGGTGPVLLGDVVASCETALAEARRDRRTIADHLSHLVVHGVLHLLGHDHRDDAEATAMEAMETRILGALGIADPYAEPPAGGTEPER